MNFHVKYTRTYFLLCLACSHVGNNQGGIEGDLGSGCPGWHYAVDGLTSPLSSVLRQPCPLGAGGRSFAGGGCPDVFGLEHAYSSHRETRMMPSVCIILDTSPQMHFKKHKDIMSSCLYNDDFEKYNQIVRVCCNVKLPVILCLISCHESCGQKALIILKHYTNVVENPDRVQTYRDSEVPMTREYSYADSRSRHI